MSYKINKDLLDLLLCPICGGSLKLKKYKLVCLKKHSFNIKSGVPMMVKLNKYLKKESEAWEDKWEKNISSRALKAYNYNMKIFKELGYWEETGIATRKIASKKDYTVLDLGCGNGVSTNNIKGQLVIGLDLSESQLIKAKKDFTNKQFIVGDAIKLPFKDDSFDLVLAINLLHHIPNTEKVLEECWRVLKKGGHFLSVDPNFYNPIGFIGRNLYKTLKLNKVFPSFPQFALGEEEKQFSKKSYVELFNKSPFKSFKIKPHRIERILFFSTILFPFLIDFPGYKEILLFVSKIGNKIVQYRPFDQICYFWKAEARK